MIVYRYRCAKNGCTSYIGKTKRHLLVRVKEHRTASQSSSAVFNHLYTCDCSVRTEDFEILHRTRNEYDLNIAEALLISYHKPNLNRTLANHGASLYLRL